MGSRGRSRSYESNLTDDNYAFRGAIKLQPDRLKMRWIEAGIDTGKVCQGKLHGLENRLRFLVVLRLFQIGEFGESDRQRRKQRNKAANRQRHGLAITCSHLHREIR